MENVTNAFTFPQTIVRLISPNERETRTRRVSALRNSRSTAAGERLTLLPNFNQTKRTARWHFAEKRGDTAGRERACDFNGNAIHHAAIWRARPFPIPIHREPSARSVRHERKTIFKYTELRCESME